MGVCESEPDFKDETSFKRGEKHFYPIQEINHNGSPYSNNSRNNVYLYFSLVKIVNPKQMHSFSISIINNAKLNDEAYLGDLEEHSGKEIQFGKSFEVNYYFERKQLLLITPKINGSPAGETKKIILSDLIRNPQNSIIIFDGMGNLIISIKRKGIGEVPSENLVSSFNFNIKLSHKIFDNTMNISETYFMIYILDNDIKRALYKSQEYHVKNIVSNTINIDNESLIVNENANTPLYLVLFCPHLRQNKFIGYAEFSLRLLEYNLSMDIITNISLKSNKYGNLGNISIKYNHSVKYTFLDYLQKGLNLKLDIAIDYTASNNDPQDNQIPLHNTDPSKPNDYEEVIATLEVFWLLIIMINCFLFMDLEVFQDLLIIRMVS